MSTEQDVIQLRSRVKELEERLEYLYKHLGIQYSSNPASDNREIIDLIKAGNKIGAIKIYREIYNSGLAEAKDAIDSMEKKYL